MKRDRATSRSSASFASEGWSSALPSMVEGDVERSLSSMTGSVEVEGLHGESRVKASRAAAA